MLGAVLSVVAGRSANALLFELKAGDPWTMVAAAGGAVCDWDIGGIWAGLSSCAGGSYGGVAGGVRECFRRDDD